MIVFFHNTPVNYKLVNYYRYCLCSFKLPFIPNVNLSVYWCIWILLNVKFIAPLLAFFTKIFVLHGSMGLSSSSFCFCFNSTYVYLKLSIICCSFTILKLLELSSLLIFTFICFKIFFLSFLPVSLPFFWRVHYSSLISIFTILLFPSLISILVYFLHYNFSLQSHFDCFILTLTAIKFFIAWTLSVILGILFTPIQYLPRILLSVPSISLVSL